MITCPACRRAPLSDGALDVMLEKTLGPRWWAAPEIPEACAELIVDMRREGRDGSRICERHASWYAALAELRIRSEVARRSVPAGGILVLYGEIFGAGQEVISREEAKLAGSTIVSRVRRFVARTSLAAVVEIDDRARRARITLQIAGSDPLRSMVIEAHRLERVTAHDVVTGLDRAPAG